MNLYFACNNGNKLITLNAIQYFLCNINWNYRINVIQAMAGDRLFFRLVILDSHSIKYKQRRYTPGGSWAPSLLPPTPTKIYSRT